jgi:hypothetical protein
MDQIFGAALFGVLNFGYVGIYVPLRTKNMRLEVILHVMFLTGGQFQDALPTLKITGKTNITFLEIQRAAAASRRPAFSATVRK